MVATAQNGVSKVGGRTAIVGTGSRGQLYLRGVVDRITGPDSPNKIVAFCDKNIGRVQYYNKLLQELGQEKAAEYTADQFEVMLEKEKVEVLVVTTMDSTHDLYIVPALKRGIRVVTEKPMATDVEKCRRILQTVKETGNHLTVTFNYRYNPVHEKVKALLAGGAIGEVLSVHFEWTLMGGGHGTDYARRWHRNKKNSGGMMVHKSGHHFDLVNWWVNSQPKHVFGMGRLAFYGEKQGKKHGWARNYDRALGSEEAKNDPFAIHIDTDPIFKNLYLDNEKHDGYHRDMNPFAADIDFEDDMSVLVRYKNEVTMTYHLTSYSPWEGYRVMFNGSHGRLELEVVEQTHLELGETARIGPGSIHGSKAPQNAGGHSIVVRPLLQKPYNVEVEMDLTGHGGGDKRLLSTIFGPRKGERVDVDPASQMSATEMDGAYALAVGLAANESFKTNKMVDCEEMLRV